MPSEQELNSFGLDLSFVSLLNQLIIDVTLFALDFFRLPLCSFEFPFYCRWLLPPWQLMVLNHKRKKKISGKRGVDCCYFAINNLFTIRTLTRNVVLFEK